MSGDTTSIADRGTLGVRKSAILLLSLPPQQADEIVSRLPKAAIAAVQRQMASLRRIPTSERTAVFDEYRRQLSVATSSLPDPLEGCSPADIVAALHREHPQTVAAVLASLPVSKAGDCLAGFPIRTQIELVRRLASLRPCDDAILQEVHDTIRAQIEHQRHPVATPPALAAQQPTSGARDGFFEDLVRLDETGMRLVLEEIDDDALALAISTASRRLRRHVLGALNQTKAEAIQRAADASRPLYLCDIESAQSKILRVVKRLECSGEVSLARRGH